MKHTQIVVLKVVWEPETGQDAPAQWDWSDMIDAPAVVIASGDPEAVEPNETR